MAITYTDNLTFANPDAGECNWDDDWYRNQFFKDVICAALLSANRVVQGGEASAIDADTVELTPGNGIIEGTSVSWVTAQVDVSLAPVGTPYVSNYIYFDDTAALQCTTTPPTRPFLPIAIVDADEIDILRVVDIRPMQAVPDPGAAVSKIIAGTNIVDVFIYDTAKDPDGGTWRYGCKWCTWYSETLDTTTRGATQDFPSKVLIITTETQVILYDLSVSSVPMWMVFDTGANTAIYNSGTSTCTAAVMACGHLYVASGATDGALSDVDFKNDITGVRTTNTIRYFSRDIVNRNAVVTTTEADIYPAGLLSRNVNALAIKVLSGNDYPTVAVATAGGVSVIDGTAGENSVVNGSTLADFISIEFTEGENIVAGRNGKAVYLITDFSTDSFAPYGFLDHATAPRLLNSNCTGVEQGASISGLGLNLIAPDLTTISNSLVNRITSTEQSGWFNGDAVIAVSGGTATGTVGLDLTPIFEDDFSGTLSKWTDNSIGTGSASIVSGAASIVRVDASNKGVLTATLATVAGRMYQMSFDVTGANLQFYAGTSQDAYDLTFNDGIAPATGVIVTFRATSTTTYIQAEAEADGTTAGLDNVSIAPLQNLIINGEASSNRAWEAADGPLPANGWSIASGTITFDGSGPTTTALYPNETENILIAGKWYVLKLTVTAFTGTNTLNNYLASGNAPIIADGTGTFTQVFQAPVTRRLNIYPVLNTDVWSITDVELSEMDVPDLTGSGNPGRVIGQIDKVALNTGCDLTAWSGWGGANGVVVEDTSDIQVGTGALSYCIWVKNDATGSDNDFIVEARDLTNTGPFWRMVSTDNLLVSFGTTLYSTGYDLRVNGWNFIFATRDGSGNCKAYAQGRLLASWTDATDFTNPEAVIRLGSNVVGTGGCEQTSLTGFRVFTKEVAAADIAFIYESEKRLFAEGAQGALSQPQAVCIGYSPESDDLLIGVTNGTNHSVDMFQGCVRVETEIYESEVVAVDVDEVSHTMAENDQVTYHKQRSS